VSCLRPGCNCQYSLHDALTQVKQNRFPLVSIQSEVVNNVMLFVGFEILAAVVMKNFISWDIERCVVRLNVNRRFGGICRLHF
jgi:hypothetical protein